MAQKPGEWTNTLIARFEEQVINIHYNICYGT